MKTILTRGSAEVWIYTTEKDRDVEIEYTVDDRMVEHRIVSPADGREHYKARRKEGFK